MDMTPSPYPQVLPSRVDLIATTSARWRTYFEVVENQHADVTASDIGPLAKSVDNGLRISLPVFQISQIGTGEHLLEAARKIGDDDYVEALRLFVKEEQEHARLLALVCNELDIDMLDSHWTNTAFRFARRTFGLRAELLVLLVAEFVSDAFYAALADGVGDPVLSQIFGRIQADEVRHLDFHAATLPEFLDRWPRPVFNAVRFGWSALVVGSALIVAVDHRKALRASGVSSIRYVGAVIKKLRTHKDRIFRARS